MNNMSKRLVLLCLMMAAIVIGLAACSGDRSEENSADSSETATVLTRLDTIELMMNNAMDRLRLGDKTELYRLEFSYLKDTMSFDDYLKNPTIMAYTLVPSRVIVDSIGPANGDSIVASVRIAFADANGQESFESFSVPVYLHRGEWIKPTLSAYINQVSWDSVVGSFEREAGQ